jgi:hypothetical protein
MSPLTSFPASASSSNAPLADWTMTSSHIPCQHPSASIEFATGSLGTYSHRVCGYWTTQNASNLLIVSEADETSSNEVFKPKAFIRMGNCVRTSPPSNLPARVLISRHSCPAPQSHSLYLALRRSITTPAESGRDFYDTPRVLLCTQTRILQRRWGELTSADVRSCLLVRHENEELVRRSYPYVVTRSGQGGNLK